MNDACWNTILFVILPIILLTIIIFCFKFKYRKNCGVYRVKAYAIPLKIKKRGYVMKNELYNPFRQVCSMAKEIDSMPVLTDDQCSKLFQHVSNSDMETTIRTLRHAYYLIKQEFA